MKRVSHGCALTRALVFLFTLNSAFNSAMGDNKSLNFTTVNALRPGISTKSKVVALLGKPWRKTGRNSQSKSSNKEEIWEYRDSKGIRFSLTFPEQSQVLDSWDWSVFDKEPEENLGEMLSKLSSGSWEAEAVRWVNPHSLPNECYAISRPKGTSIEFDRIKEKVISISRWSPSRSPSESIEQEPPPKFCIDDHCTNGISGKVFMKTWQLCKLPK